MDQPILKKSTVAKRRLLMVACYLGAIVLVTLLSMALFIGLKLLGFEIPPFLVGIAVGAIMGNVLGRPLAKLNRKLRIRNGELAA